MRNRPGPEQDNERERERDKTNQRMERQERRTQTRIPKIQYRFLKELEEQGVSKETRDDAYAMAGKIRRFPLEEKHVMGSWERFTRTAIEAYKQGHGSDAERTRQHRAYAVLFSAIRGDAPIQNSLDLKIRVDKFEVEPRPRGARDEKPHAAAPVVQQRTLPLPERDTVERPEMEKRIDKALTKLRELPSEMRGTIEASARELLVENIHTPQSARAALPRALEDLKEQKNTQNAMHVFTLAAVARTPDAPALLRELNRSAHDDYRAMVSDARSRIEQYAALQAGEEALRKDQLAAAVKDVVSPSAASRREAVVLTRAYEEFASSTRPVRQNWEHVAQEMSLDF